MKAYGVSGCVDTHIVVLGSYTLRPFHPWRKPPGTQWIGGWVGLRTGLDDAEKRKIWPLPGLEH
jgi:hypothetical protein